MRLVYAHFPINPVIGSGGKDVEIRNFCAYLVSVTMVCDLFAYSFFLLTSVGEKVVRKCPMLEGVTIAEGSKDELVISGNDIENVSQSAASITDKCRVKEKDVRSHEHRMVPSIILTRRISPVPQIRKFLDGIYTSERGTVVKDTL